MSWTYESAIEKIESMFPSLETLVHDGCHEYVVGTVEDDEGVIHASFRLTFKEPGLAYGEIMEMHVSAGEEICGTVPLEVAQTPRDGSRAKNYVPFSLSETWRGMARGRVGDYEVRLPLTHVITMKVGTNGR